MDEIKSGLPTTLKQSVMVLVAWSRTYRCGVFIIEYAVRGLSADAPGASRLLLVDSLRNQAGCHEWCLSPDPVFFLSSFPQLLFQLVGHEKIVLLAALQK